MDAVTAGLIGTIIGAAINSASTSMSSVLASRATDKREKKGNISKERTVLYRAISAEMASLEEGYIDSGVVTILPKSVASRDAPGSLELWASKGVQCSYRIYHFILLSNNFFRLREAAPVVGDILTGRILGFSDGFIHDYRILCSMFHIELNMEPSVSLMDGITRESVRVVMSHMRHELGLT